MFASKAAYPSKAPFRCSTLGKAPDLAHKLLARPERLARDKYVSLLQAIVNYDHKFNTLGCRSSLTLREEIIGPVPIKAPML
jgi:hypothetical protein